MNIDKSQLLNLLRSNADDEQADRAERELPDQVDPDRDRGLLERLGLDVDDIVQKLGGGDGMSGLIGV
jgi:hypothetical protein